MLLLKRIDLHPKLKKEAVLRDLRVLDYGKWFLIPKSSFVEKTMIELPTYPFHVNTMHGKLDLVWESKLERAKQLAQSQMSQESGAQLVSFRSFSGLNRYLQNHIDQILNESLRFRV